MTEENSKELEKVDTQKAEDGNTDKENTEEGLGAIPDEVLKGIPLKERKEISRIMMSSSSMMGRMPNPMMEKITPEHIDKILDHAGKSDERAYEDHGTSRKFTLAYVLISIALFIFLTLYLVETNKALYLEILKLAITFVGGFGGGFGIKTYIDRNR